MESVAIGGATLAWLGASLLSLSDGRRGQALGLGLVALALAAAVGAAGAPAPAAAAVALGGLCSAALRLRGGEAGWGIMPPGSTPRLIASLVVLIAVGLVFGASINVPAGAVRLAALVVALLSVGRLLTTDRRWAALGAAAALALALGALGGTATLLTGAAVAVALGAIGGAEVPEARG
jgi:hypothetical protein